MNYNQQGVTLIEIAIVLVIMGLIVGTGLLSGQSLVQGGHAKEVIETASDLIGAVQKFKERYHYFPGDLPDAGDDISNIPVECDYSRLEDPNAGNGVIEAATISSKKSELFCAAIHLYQAGFLKSNPNNEIGGYIRTRFGQIHLISRSDVADQTKIPTTVRNVLEFEGLPFEIAVELDIALDDGNISTGKMLADDTTRTSLADGDVVQIVNYFIVPL
ncbi:MAG: prepilin-type N-terminal cleavage/methylation domain-containing protein [Magnetococcus sp. DMHC-6]